MARGGDSRGDEGGGEVGCCGHCPMLCTLAIMKISAEDLRRRYPNGDHDYSRADLAGIDLHNASFSHANFTEANLKGANLKGADFFACVFDGARLLEADLQEARLWESSFARADLRDANLMHARLNRARLECADLRRANLREADFTAARLTETLLGGANLDRACLMEADVQKASLVAAHVTRANLRAADLRGANLQSTKFAYSDLTEADLSAAKLTSADLHSANLTGADLSRATLTRASMRHATLKGTRLRGARLQEAVLERALCVRTDFDDAVVAGLRLGQTVLLGVDVTPLTSGEVFHRLPSMCDWATVSASLRAPRLVPFLCELGIPEVFATYMVDCAKSLDPGVLFSMMQTVFISYGRPDEVFSKKLRDALQMNGVRTWHYLKDAIPGEQIHRTISDQVNKHDRVILVCSAASLSRNGVLHEIEQVLAREARDGGSSILIPIQIDEALFDEGWAPEGKKDLARQIADRVVADFRGTENDEAKFQEQLGRILLALKKGMPTEPPSSE